MRKLLTEEEKKERKKEGNRKQRERAKADPELRARRKEYNRRHREKTKADPERTAKNRESSRRYVAENYEKVKASVNRYQAQNKEKVVATRRKSKKKRRENPIYLEGVKKYEAEYRSRPETKILERERRKKGRAKRTKNPASKLLDWARGRIGDIRRWTKLGKVPKRNRSRFFDHFGAEPETVIRHISSLFSPCMGWENWGKVWHVDHIVPICRGFGNIELLTKLNHYKNLRPLLKAENLSKGNKTPDFFPEGVPFTKEEVGWEEVKAPAVLSVG